MARWNRRKRGDVLLVGLCLLCLAFVGKTFAGASTEHARSGGLHHHAVSYSAGEKHRSARNLQGEEPKNSETACSSEYIRKNYLSRRARCTHVRENCKSEGLLNYFEIYYCTALLPKDERTKEAEQGSTLVNEIVFWSGLAVGLVVLFRVLGTTADDYFAPTLTELCRGK